MTLRRPYQRMQSMAAILMLAMLSACASLGLPTAQTFNEKLAVAYGSVTQVRETAAQLLVAKKITVEDAVNVQVAADTARQGLDVARAQHATDPTGTMSKLDAIRTALTALAGYLATRGGS